MLKLKLKLVQELKKMNTTYPTSTGDYDFIFLKQLACSVFKKEELKKCGKSEVLTPLNRCHLKFVKGNICFQKIANNPKQSS